MADGTVTIKANFDGKDAESGVSRIKSALNGLKQSTGKIGSVFKSVLGANLVSSGITTAIGEIKSGLSSMVGELSSSTKAWQTFEGNLQQLNYGSDQIKAAKTEMQDYATKTVYSASDMASTYAQLAAVGVKDTGQLVKAFGGLAGAAENPAQAMKTLSQQATQMAAKPTVQWQDFKLMLEQTPAGMAAVAKSMGMTTSELVTAVQDGAVKTEDFFNKMIEVAGSADSQFQKMATEFKTVDQAMDGLKEGAANKLMPVFDKVNQFGIKAISAISDKIGELDFGPMADKIGAFLDGIDINGIIDKIAAGVGKIVAFGSQVKEFFSNFANTGAFSALGSAFTSIAGAVGNFFAAISGGKGDWADFGTTLGNVVTKLAEGATKVADFVGKMDPGRLQSWIATIAAVAGGFKIFSAVTGSSPIGAILDKLGNKFSIFGNKGKAGTDKAGSGTGLLGQLFQGVGTLITSVASGISTVLQGLGTAISTVAQGFGRAAAMASPTQWLSMGAAMLMVGAGVALASAGIYILVQAAIQLASAGTGAQIAMVAFGVGIAALAGIFALLGPALTAGAVGIGVFGAAVLAIGAGIALASAGLSMLAGHLPQIAAYGASAGVAIAALGAGMLAMGAGAMVAGAGLMVAGAGLAVVGAGALVAAAGAAVLGAGLLVTAAGVAAFGLALNLAQPGISTFSSAITKVVSAISGGLTSVINAVSGAIRSVGTASLNAGKGFNQLATGIGKITSLNIIEMGASLAAVAAGLVAIVASGIGTAGPGLQVAGTGLRLIATSAQMASATIQLLPTAFSTLSASLGTLPAMMTMAGTAMMAFATSAQGSVMSLMAIGATITQFATMMMTIGPASGMASAGLAMFNGQASSAGNAMQRLGSSAQSAQASVVSLGSGIVSSMAGATAAIASAGSQMSSAVRSAGTQMLTAMQSAMNQVTSSVRNGMTNSASAVRNGGSQMASALKSSGSQMVSTTQSFMNQITSTVRNGMNNIVSAVRNGGSQMVSAMRSAGTQLVTTVQSAVNQAANAARSGYGAFQSAGSYIGEGLAVGMRSALGAVIAAANELVAQANRAAQAKAKINSPSHLFRDEVGWWIGLGVAKGIDNSAPEVANSLDFIRDQVHGFSLKSQNLLTGATASMSSQLRLETLRGKTPKVEADARQEAYIAHSASLLSEVIDSLAELRDQVAQGQQMVLDTGALVGGTAHAYDNAIGTLQSLKGRHRL
ncbi:TPA: tape measure protein [Streptococcus suis]